MIEIPLPILILQHPQEPSRQDKDVSSAQLICNALRYSHCAVGLSWRNLGHALKKFESIQGFSDLTQPAAWATLYLGTKAQSQHQEATEPGLYFLNKKGEFIESPKVPIGGLILLDGTWAQAKTLWWRNPWLLKTQRMHLIPKQKSRYGKIRKEPRPECVSTLEAAAEALTFMGIDPQVEIELIQQFEQKLNEYKEKRR